MKVVLLQGSIVGSKTRTALKYIRALFEKKYSDLEITVLDLADYDLPFSDGRNYLEYSGDAAHVTQALLEADAIVFGTPVFQASIPATLKNVFDLLPEEAFLDKVVSVVVTAGSSKHFLVAETQLKPIITYMKGQTVQSYVFVEEQDFYRKEIVNDDVLFRMERLVEDTFSLTAALKKIQVEKDAEYGF